MFPPFLIAPARAGKVRWSATAVAAVYTGLTLGMMWILQLVPARPMLAPVYNPVTHLQPPTFPLLLVVPAAAFDLLMTHFGSSREWRLAVALGLAFVAALLAVQWLFSEFLLSPWARNFLFAADHWNYGSRLGPWRYEYWDLDTGAGGKWSAARFARGLGLALALAIATSRLGLARGKWMAQVKR